MTDGDHIDWSVCHCGSNADGHLMGYCAHCSNVRCDAFPGECGKPEIRYHHPETLMTDMPAGWQYAEYIPAGDPRHPQYQPPHVCGVECVHNQAALERRSCPSDDPHERHSWNAWPAEATWFLCMGDRSEETPS